MFVITRNGETITGWRAWLIGAVLYVVTAAVLVVVAFVLLGVTLTIAAVLLFIVPLALAFAFIVTRMRSGGPR